MRVLGIDPGTTESGVVIWDGKDVIFKEKLDNHDVLFGLRAKNCDIIETTCDIFPWFGCCVIESINPYTMGKTTRDTLLWSGRFQEAIEQINYHCKYISRVEVRQNLCNSGSSSIGDSVIIQALVDRFAYGQKNKGKGNKEDPGFFYGFHDDIWQAFALSVTYYDLNL